MFEIDPVKPKAFLQVSKSSKTNWPEFKFRDAQVFLSGANQAWIQYGSDFGNNQTKDTRCSLQDYITSIASKGGNSMRIWLFVEGQTIPSFDSSGRVVASDSSNTLLADLKTYLRFAASKNVFVNLTLWNGALMRNKNYENLIHDTGKL